MRPFIIILMLCLSFPLFAVEKPVYDSSGVTPREFSNNSFDRYRDSKEFQYETKIVETPSLWERFWVWAWRKYTEIMSTPAGRATMKVLYWGIAIGAILFFVFKVTRMNRLAMFANDAKNSTGYKIESEDIHAIAFEAAIRDALQNGNYRLAVRLLYLQNLKLLSDRNMIAWQPNKTNTDYWREITNSQLQQSFKKVTGIFEYAWYGSHAVTKDDYTLMHDELIQFQNRL